jgi:hypothetical protein
MDDLAEKAYARCKACDSQFYPLWIKEWGIFEELCPKCLEKIDYSDETDYNNISDDRFIDGYLLDKR